MTTLCIPQCVYDGSTQLYGATCSVQHPTSYLPLKSYAGSAGFGGVARPHWDMCHVISAMLVLAALAAVAATDAAVSWNGDNGSGSGSGSARNNSVDSGSGHVVQAMVVQALPMVVAVASVVRAGCWQSCRTG